MIQQNTVLEALETVIVRDLPDKYLANALNDQAALMAGIDPEDTWLDHSDSHFPSQY